MKNLNKLTLLIVLICFGGCKTSKTIVVQEKEEEFFTIAFGSCNKHTVENNLWDDVLAADPDVWIWGGDIVYADTGDAQKIKGMYDIQRSLEGYSELMANVPIIGTWDDHDYGLNDGGVEFTSKKESQQVFLDFLDVPQESPRRNQEGVYVSNTYDLQNGSVKILVLDTRYFRSALTKAKEAGKRYGPGVYGEGTVLGAEQWAWLENELNESTADFNILVSSVQFLSNEHGFECWGNFPHEVDKLKEVVKSSNAKGVMILSGDRHISEFSVDEVGGMSYPLIDFTSSGLTHVYSSYTGEPNPYRIGKVVATKSFGLVQLNLKSKEASLKMIGDNGEILNSVTQKY